MANILLLEQDNITRKKLEEILAPEHQIFATSKIDSTDLYDLDVAVIIADLKWVGVDQLEVLARHYNNINILLYNSTQCDYFKLLKHVDALAMLSSPHELSDIKSTLGNLLAA